MMSVIRVWGISPRGFYRYDWPGMWPTLVPFPGSDRDENGRLRPGRHQPEATAPVRTAGLFWLKRKDRELCSISVSIPLPSSWISRQNGPYPNSRRSLFDLAAWALMEFSAISSMCNDKSSMSFLMNDFSSFLFKKRLFYFRCGSFVYIKGGHASPDISGIMGIGCTGERKRGLNFCRASV